MLSADIKKLELLKRTYPHIKTNGYQIGEKIYQNMFKEHPETEQLFKNTPPVQAQKLIDAILFYCEEVDNFELFYDRLDKIAHVHIKHSVKNEYYPYMKNAFLDALREVLKADATDELVRAWAYGFDRLSSELIHIKNLISKYKT